MKKLIMLTGFFLGGAVMAIEEPSFEVIKKTESYEVRSYPKILVAETMVEGDFGDAGNLAFRVLADYIFGNNQSQTKIAMTAPVTQEAPSEKIAMTAPVTLEGKGPRQFQVQFVIPSTYTLETLPKPKDSRVTLRELPPRKVAVYRYSGSWGEEKYQRKLSEFRTMLSQDGLSVQGEPIFSRFDSPFRLWFLRRNEIWLPIGGI